MPLPTPNSGEGHDEFIDRCMSDDAMKSEYEDGKQRLDVCESQWEGSRSMEMERRDYPQEVVKFSLEKRQADGEGPAKKPDRIVGHAAVFNSLSEDLGGLREIILPGAFTKTLKDKDDVRALVDHDPSKILGRTTAGTLELREDKKGLAVDIDTPDTTVGRDIVESIGRKDVSKMSFGFRTIEDRWITKDGEDVRELVAAKLYDVSPVTFPAYAGTDTTIAKRSHDAWKTGAETTTTGNGAVVAAKGSEDPETIRAADMVAEMAELAAKKA